MIPVYVIHLPNPERKARIAAELARVGFTDITYVHAQEPAKGFTMSNMRRNPRGEFGCSLSHIKAITRAVTDYCAEALFVEDDVEFSADFDAARLSVAGGWKKWNVVYLGGHPRGPAKRVDHQLVRVSQFSCAEAYMLHSGSMREFLEFWCDRAGQPNAMFDFILGEYAAQGGGYAFYPTLTHQPVGWSHIGQKVDDKSACIEKGWRTNLA